MDGTYGASHLGQWISRTLFFNQVSPGMLILGHVAFRIFDYEQGYL